MEGKGGGGPERRRRRSLLWGESAESLEGLTLGEFRSLAGSEREDVEERLFAELSAFRRATSVMRQTISTELSLTESLVELQKAILDVLCCERVTLFVVDERTKEIRSQSGLDARTPVIRVPFGKGVAGWVAETGEALNIPDAYESPLFNPEIDKTTGYRTRNILCYPIRDTSGATVAVMQGLNRHGGPFTSLEEKNLEVLSATMGNQIRLSQLRAEAAKERKRSRALHQCMKSMAGAETLYDIRGVILDTTVDLVDAERAVLLLHDEVRKDLWAVGGGVERVPLGQTIAGKAAQENRSLRIDHTLDSERDLPRMKAVRGRSNGHQTERSGVGSSATSVVEGGGGGAGTTGEHPVSAAMAVPVHDKAGRVVGVLLVLNKRGADIDFTVDRSFTDIDCEAMEIFAVELGEAIAKRAAEAAFANVMYSKGEPGGDNVDADEHREAHYAARDAFMSQLLDFRESRARERAPSRGDVGTPDTPTGHRMQQAEERHLMQRRGSIRRAFLMRWDLDILSLSKQGLVDLCVDIFRDANVLEPFGLGEDAIRSFVQAACAQYQDVPYHNFCHATHVVHATYMLMMTHEVLEYLTPLDRLTLLIAAVGHDINHDGRTNSFHVASGSDIAWNHNDASVLENHHCAMTWRLLADGPAALLRDLAPGDKTYLRSTLIALILSTDMSQHLELLTEFKNAEFSPEMGSCEKLLFMKALLHSADMGNAVRAFRSAHALSQNVQTEFAEQVGEERERGIPSAPHMDPANNLVAWNLEANFIEYVCLPLWLRLSEAVPSLAPCIVQIHHTRDQFQLLAAGRDAEVDLQDGQWRGFGEEVPVGEARWGSPT